MTNDESHLQPPTAWHTIDEVAEDVYRISEPLGALEPRYALDTVNMYLVVGEERAALIDTGVGIGDLRAVASGIAALPVTVLNSHSHWDHWGGNAPFDDVAIHPVEAEALTQEPDLGDLRDGLRTPGAQAVLPAGFDPAAYRIRPKPATRFLRDGDVIDLGGRTLQVLHTPGHSPGHVAFLEEAAGLLFTADAAYRGPLFANFEGCDPGAFVESVKRLAALGDVRLICPGHQDVIEDPNWLLDAALGVEAAFAGHLRGEVREGFMTGREFRFETFSFWLPAG